MDSRTTYLPWVLGAVGWGLSGWLGRGGFNCGMTDLREPKVISLGRLFDIRICE